MKTVTGRNGCGGLTLVEVLVVLAVLAVLFWFAGVDLNGTHKLRIAKQTQCMSNQRQVALGLCIYQADSQRFPWQAGTNGSGDATFAPSNHVSAYLKLVAKQYNPPKRTEIFLCPTEKTRQPGLSMEQLRDENVSYFLNLGAESTNDSVILGGERHLEADSRVVGAGRFDFKTNTVMGWTHELHGAASRGPAGGLFFSDGHVEFTRDERMNGLFRSQPSVSVTRLAIP